VRAAGDADGPLDDATVDLLGRFGSPSGTLRPGEAVCAVLGGP
jgi:hypothetical protein